MISIPRIKVFLITVVLGVLVALAVAMSAAADNLEYTVDLQIPPMLESSVNNVVVTEAGVVVFHEYYHQGLQAFRYTPVRGFEELWHIHLSESASLSSSSNDLVKAVHTVLPGGGEGDVLVSQVWGCQGTSYCIAVINAASGEEILRQPHPFGTDVETLGVPVYNINASGFWMILIDSTGTSKLAWFSWEPISDNDNHTIVYDLPKDISYRSNYAFSPNGSMIAIAFDDKPDVKYPEPREIHVYNLEHTPPTSITIDVLPSTTDEFIIGLEWMKSGRIAVFLNNFSIVMVDPDSLDMKLVNTNLGDIVYGSGGSRDYMVLVENLHLGFHDDHGRLVLPVPANQNLGLDETNILLVFDENYIVWRNDGAVGDYSFHPVVIDSYNDLIAGSRRVGVGPGIIAMYEGGAVRIANYEVFLENGDIRPVLTSNKLYLNGLGDGGLVKALPNGSLLIGIENIGENPDRGEKGMGYVIGVLDRDTREIVVAGSIGVSSEERTSGGFIPIHYTLVWTPHIDSVALSPDGHLVAVAGSLELYQDYSIYSVTPDEKGFIRVYDLGAGSTLWSYDVSFTTKPSSGGENLNQGRMNIFAPSLQFLSGDRLMVLFEQYNYGSSVHIYQLLVLELGENTGVTVAYNATLSALFLPGGPGIARGGTAVADEDGRIYMVYSYEKISEEKHEVVNYTVIDPLEGGMVLNTTLIDSTDIEWISTIIPEIDLEEGDSPAVYMVVLARKQLSYTTWWGEQESYIGYDTLLLKVDAGSGSILKQVNLTDHLDYPGTRLPAGAITGLELSNETLYAFVEATPINKDMCMAHPLYNLILLSRDLEVLGTLSMGSYANKTFENEERQVWINNNPELNLYTPINIKFDIFDTGSKALLTTEEPGSYWQKIILIRIAAHPSMPGGGGQGAGGEEIGEQGAHVAVKVHLTEQQRKLIEEAEEKVREVSRHLSGLLGSLSPATGNTTLVKEVFEETNLTGIVDELVDEGLMDPPVELPSEGRLALREVLESIYGPLLANYPDPMGRLYLLYVLYYQE